MSGASSPLDDRGLPPGLPVRPELEVTPRYVRDRLASGAPDDEFVLLDCRRPEERQFAAIEPSIFIPMQQIEQRADELEDEEGGRGREIVVYCHHGNRSLRVALALRAMGYTNVKSMAGGIDVWSMDIDQRVPRY